MDKYKSVRLIFPQNTNLQLVTLLRRQELSRHVLDTRVIKYKKKVILAIQALSDSISAYGYLKNLFKMLLKLRFSASSHQSSLRFFYAQKQSDVLKEENFNRYLLGLVQ